MAPREPRTPPRGPVFRVLEDLDQTLLFDEYLATDEAGQSVSLFALRSRLREDAEVRDLFFSLARRAALLSHPGIPRTLGLADEDSTAYVAVERSPGVPLRRLLAASEGHRLPAGTAAFVAWRVADILAHAHAAPGGPVLHLAFGPDQVWLDGPQGVQLIRFGIGDALRQVEGRVGCLGPASVWHPALDRSMPPEATRGLPLTTRSDIYRAGALLLRMLTGAFPGHGRHDIEIIRSIMQGEWDAGALDQAGVLPSLASVVHRCLATDPAERFPDAAALRDALAGLAQG